MHTLVPSVFYRSVARSTFTFPLVVVAMLSLSAKNEASTASFRCQSYNFQPCTTKVGPEQAGFYCDSSHSSCVPKPAWCSIRQSFIMGSTCENSRNLMFDSCMSAEAVVDGIKYYISSVDAEWSVAAQLCQTKDMHLVSFSSQKQYDRVITLLNQFEEGKRTDNLNTLNDPIGQRCWTERQKYIGVPYWTGLYADLRNNSWTSVDGSQIYNVSSVSTTLANILNKFHGTKNLGRLMIVSNNLTFVMPELNQQPPRVDAGLNIARVLCAAKRYTTSAKGAIAEWNGRLLDENAGCITGFKCSGRREKCIVGSAFYASQVCNGIDDCENGSDEFDYYCPSIVEPFPDGSRYGHFFGVRRTASTIRRFCMYRNMTLPSLRTHEDIKFLKGLKTRFRNSRTFPDFFLLDNQLNSDSSTVLLGIKGSAAKWDDGSPIRVYYSKIRRLPPSVNVYLTTTKGEELISTDESEDGRLSFIMCQQKAPTIVIPVPIFVQLSYSSTITSTNVYLLFATMTLTRYF